MRRMNGEMGDSPLRIGWNSIRANWVPMLVLWAAAALMAVAYYRIPWFADVLAPVGRWQARNGVVAAFATQFVFCGVLPAIFLHAVRGIRTDRPLLKCLLQSVWSGCWGVVYLWFYSLQARMFGEGHDIATLLSKVAFDEFVWSPFTSVPLTSLFFLWLGSGFSLERTVQTCRRGFFRRVLLPTLFSNWAVWIPTVTAIYAFPLDLQIFMLGLVSCFWMLVCLQLGKRAHGAKMEGNG